MTKIIFNFSTNQEASVESADHKVESSRYKDNVICMDFRSSPPAVSLNTPEGNILRELQHTFYEYK